MCVHFNRVTYFSGALFMPQYCTQFLFTMFTKYVNYTTYFDNGMYYLVIICLEHSLIRDYDPVQGLCTKKAIFFHIGQDILHHLYKNLNRGLLNRG